MSAIEYFQRAALVAALAAASGCATSDIAPAPVVDRSVGSVTRGAAPSGAARASPGSHVVQKGETLYSIAAAYGVDYHDLAKWNQLDDPTRIQAGQTLRLSPPVTETASRARPAAEAVQIGSAPGAGRVEAQPIDARLAPRGAPSTHGMKTSPKALRLPYSEDNYAMLAKAEAATDASAARAGTAAASGRASGAPEFIWPASGKLTAKFSEPNSRGVDIAGQLGDPVVAAAPGRVMYTGTGIRGYGKLIVIRHQDGFNSVYAHNKEILVKEGQNVARGQKIGEVGETEADSPKLHFEIRQSGKPVDPLKYLPPRPAS